LGGLSVTLKVQTAWRRNYDWISDGGRVQVKPGNSGVNGDSLPFEGDVVEVPEGSKGNKWYYGDGIDHLFSMTVTAPYGDPTVESSQFKLNQFLATSLFRHSYATPTDGGLAWKAGFFGCCRLSARPDGDPKGAHENGLNNNGFFNWNIQTTVDLSQGPDGGQASSAFAVGKPILRLRMDFKEVFDIVAVHPNDLDMTWDLGNAEEMGDVEGAGGYYQPGYGNNLQRDDPPKWLNQPMTPTNELVMETVMVITDEGDIYYAGEAHWDTNGLQTGYWQSTIMIKDDIASIPYDFLMLLQDARGNEPPTWSAPTPGTADVMSIFCEKTLTFTMLAEDSLKTREKMSADQMVDGGATTVGPDAISILMINVPPSGMRHSSQEALGEFEGAPLQNPTRIVSTWTPTCAQQGKHIICYQPEDDNIIQSLEGRVRCVVIKVKKVVNVAPRWIAPTPLPPREQSKIQVCIGSEAYFKVTAVDDNEEDEFKINFNSVPEGAVLGAQEANGKEIPVGEAEVRLQNNPASRNFTWAPKNGDMLVRPCYIATEDRDTTDPEPALSSVENCVDIEVRYPPVFNGVTPEEGSVIKGNVGSELAFTLYAMDANNGTSIYPEGEGIDEVAIKLVEDGSSSKPTGMTIGPDTCERQVGDNMVCNPVSRVAKWTPVMGQEDKEYPVCFQAQDDKSTCEAGGYKGKKRCFKVLILAAEPEWVDPTPEPAGEALQLPRLRRLQADLHHEGRRQEPVRRGERVYGRQARPAQRADARRHLGTQHRGRRHVRQPCVPVDPHQGAGGLHVRDLLLRG